MNPINNDQPTPAGDQPMPTSLVSNAPSTAGDTDEIEQEWVNKVQQIIQQTIGDPFRQANELNQLKSDYMQKRYGRSIKATDE